MAAVVLLAWGIIVSAVWSRLYGPLGALLPFAILPALVVLAGRAAFHHWQIRRRSLDPLSVFLRDPGAWIPPSSGGDGRMLASWLVVAVGMLLTVPTAALAATGSTATDQALSIINALLPFASSSSVSSATATAFSSALGIMSAFLSGIGGGMLAYHSVVGTIATAHEGKVLGQRWHQIWAPLRVVSGFALLAPLPSGFSAVHGIVYDVAVQSNTLANSVWTTYVNKILGTDSAAVTAPGIPPSVGGAEVAEQIARSEICAAVLIARSKISGTTPAASLPDAGGKFVASAVGRGKLADGSGLQIWHWGGPCGALSLPVPPSASADPIKAFSTVRIAAVSSLISAMRSGERAIAQTSAVWAEGGPNGYDYSLDFPTGVQVVFDTLGQTYDSVMLTGAATLSADQNKVARQNLKDAAAVGGWMQAFAYDRAIGQASLQTATMASEAPSWTHPIVVPDARGLGPGADKEGVTAVGKVLAALDDELARERGAGQLTAPNLAAAGASSDSYLTGLLEGLDHRVSGAVVDFTAASASDPVDDMMSLGAKLTAAGEAASLAAVSASGSACNAAGALVGACDAVKSALPFVRPIIWACFAAGYVLQFLLPMLPWIAGLWLSIGFVIGTVEIIIVAPIWAFLLIRMDGQELFDSVHRPGLIILMNWALRPALGILGYIGCRTIVPLCMPLLTKYFGTAYIGSQGGHYSGVIGTLGGVFLMSFLTYQIMSRLYSMIITIPDRLPRLLGAPGDGMADAESHSGGTKGIVATTGSAGHMAPGAGPSGGGGSGGKRRGGGGASVR
ncbi:MAG: DotA/TraY family protein, partial [Telmatospirillum sp.]|nr:DotA/TraY family protein [Telmatospirillum sp.]